MKVHGSRSGSAGAKPVGIWIRVSTEDQVRGESPEHHEHRARAYAEVKGWNVRDVYRLDAVSGKAVMQHPEAQRMLGDIRAGRISGLIFSKLARLARNTKELLEFSEIFREHGADLISLQESIDTSSPAGRLFYTMIAAMAQWEREEIGERIAASIPIRAKLGKPLAGSATFGYQWKDGKLIPHPTEAPIRRRIYELFVEHQRLGTVARILNESGCRTRRGSVFNHTNLTWLIRDSTAKGVRRANYTRERSGTKGWEFKPKDQWVMLDVDPVVSAEVWDRANALLEDNRVTGRRHGRPPVQVFAGCLVCACGVRMYAHSKNPKFVCRACRNKIPIADLDAIFHEHLKGFLFSPEEMAKHIVEADTASQGKEQVLFSLQTEAQQVAQEMEKTYRLYLADQVPLESFGSIYRPLEQRKKQLEDEIPRLQAELDFGRIQALSRDEILSQARDLYSRWPEFTPEERRAIVEAIVERIHVGRDSVEIWLKYQPPPAAADHPETGDSGRGQSGRSASGPPGAPARRSPAIPETRAGRPSHSAAEQASRGAPDARPHASDRTPTQGPGPSDATTYAARVPRFKMTGSPAPPSLPNGAKTGSSVPTSGGTRRCARPAWGPRRAAPRAAPRWRC